MDMAPPGFGRAQSGRTNTFLCPYHFWGYDLTGRLRSAKYMDHASDFEPDTVCLKTFRSSVWLGFVWITFDDEVAPVEQVYGDLGKRLESFNIANLKVFVNIDWDCPFNWKMLVENFMEPYHHSGAHVKSFEAMLPARYCWTEDDLDEILVGHLPFAESILSEFKAGTSTPCTLPEITGVADPYRSEWTVYCGMPLFLFITAPEKIYWYRIFPSGPGMLRLSTVLLVDRKVLELPDVEERRQKEDKMLRDFNLEDMEVLVGMQRGLASSGYAPGRLSHLEKAVWQLQRFLAKKIRHAAASAV
jgi:phenylpropionate dioxygenase-like ring-hydroxylating dioxygenase large terminal subunit